MGCKETVFFETNKYLFRCKNIHFLVAVCGYNSRKRYTTIMSASNANLKPYWPYFNQKRRKLNQHVYRH